VETLKTHTLKFSTTTTASLLLAAGQGGEVVSASRTAKGRHAAVPKGLSLMIICVPQRIGLRDISAALVGRSILATTTSRLAWLLA
jgi:hypothetical protein